MSEQQQPDPITPANSDPANSSITNSSPTTGGGLLLRVVLIGAAVLAGVVGIVWYAARK
jgi:uncharacterized protein HemX